MTISVSCPSCGKVLQAKESAAGKQAKCPDCGDTIQIPQLDVLGDALDAEEVGGPGDIDLADEEASLPATSDRKPCPACGEMIVKGAAKCRFCGEILDPTLKQGKATNNIRSGRLSDNEQMTTSDWVICVVCPGIGCIGGIIYMIQGKPKGSKIFGISFLFVIVWNVVSLIVRTLAKG